MFQNHLSLFPPSRNFSVTEIIWNDGVRYSDICSDFSYCKTAVSFCHSTDYKTIRVTGACPRPASISPMLHQLSAIGKIFGSVFEQTVQLDFGRLYVLPPLKFNNNALLHRNCTSCLDMLTANLFWWTEPLYSPPPYIPAQHISRRHVIHFTWALKRKVLF